MQETPIAPENRQHIRPSGRTIISSVLVGVILGLAAGLPLGWLAHRVFSQQRAAQVLLCRQRHYGQPETELQRLCGSVF